MLNAQFFFNASYLHFSKLAAGKGASGRRGYSGFIHVLILVPTLSTCPHNPATADTVDTGRPPLPIPLFARFRRYRKYFRGSIRFSLLFASWLRLGDTILLVLLLRWIYGGRFTSFCFGLYLYCFIPLVADFPLFFVTPARHGIARCPETMAMLIGFSCKRRMTLYGWLSERRGAFTGSQHRLWNVGG